MNHRATIKRISSTIVITLLVSFPIASSAQITLPTNPVRSDLSQTIADYSESRNIFLKKHDLSTTRDYLNQMIVTLEERLLVTRNWIEESDRLLVMDKEVLLAEIDSDLSELESFKKSVTNVSDANVISLARDIKSFWSEHSTMYFEYTTRLSLSRQSFALNEIDSLTNRIDNHIDSSEKSTQDLEKILEEIHVTLDSSQKKIEEARNILQKSKENRDITIRESKQLSEESYALIQKTRNLIQDILKQI